MAALQRVRIRRATEDDMDAVLDMDRACLPWERNGAPEQGDHVRWWAAEIDGDLAGYAAARFAYSCVGGLYLSRAGVAVWARGGGIQRKMIRAREAWGRRKGLHVAITDASGTASMINLIRCGYLPWDPDYPWALRESTYWRRSIVQPEPKESA